MTRSCSVALVIAAVVGSAGCSDDSAVNASGCQTVTVEIGDFTFDPTPVAITPCASVVWKNTHNQAHTSTGNATKRWATGNIQPGSQSTPVVFETEGDFTYICALHPFMNGNVKVRR